MKSNENLSEAGVAGMGGVFLKRRHPLCRAGAGQVVHAEMERLAAIGGAPLDGNRNTPRAGHGAQKHGRLDVVVVGDGNHRCQVQLFDLPRFQIEGQLGSHGRRPVAGCVVDAHAVHLLGPPFQPGEQWAHHRILVAKVGQEIQGLARLVGVTVQRNTGPEAFGGLLVAPQIRN